MVSNVDMIKPETGKGMASRKRNRELTKTRWHLAHVRPASLVQTVLAHVCKRLRADTQHSLVAGARESLWRESSSSIVAVDLEMSQEKLMLQCDDVRLQRQKLSSSTR